MAGTNKRRIGLILKGSFITSRRFREWCVVGGDFPGIAIKVELVFLDGHYYL
jgi:hypothetical protein